MADNLQNQQTNAQPTDTEKLQHSGNLGLEQPVTEFDKTSLETAAQEDERGNRLLHPLPDTTEQLPADLKVEPKKSRAGRIALAIGSGAAVVAATVFALAGGGGDKDPAPVKTTEEVNPPDAADGTITPKGYDFQGPLEGEKLSFTFKPEFATSDSAPEVLRVLSSNTTKMYSELNPDYLDYISYGRDTPYGSGVLRRLNGIENYYDIDFTFELKSEAHEGVEWVINVVQVETIEGKITRVPAQLRLVPKQIPATDKNNTTGKDMKIWVISRGISTQVQ